MIIKDCPFCGSGAMLDQNESPGSLRGFYWVIRCTECPAEMEHWCTDKELLFKDWNKRLVSEACAEEETRTVHDQEDQR